MAEYTNVYNIINAMYNQATGKNDLTAVDSSSFVSVANTILATGYDNFMNAMSTVLTRSIFAFRPYNEKFRIIEADSQRFGNHIRKISPLDDEAKEEVAYSLTDGYGVDQWIVNKPKAVQFNYYDKKIWSRWISLPITQIDGAISSESEFARFVSMVMGNLTNQIAQDREDAKRLTFNNYMMGVYQDNEYSPNGRVINLLAEYNTETGNSYTTSTIYDEDNFTPFIRWCSARILNVSDHLTERGYRYHKNITGINIPRHTPKEYQKFVLMSDFYRKIESTALATTFHENLVKGFGGFEPINYLQSSKDGERDSISMSKYVSLADNGQVFTSETGTYTITGFVGAIFDRDAMLVTTVDEQIRSTGVNARGLYENLWYHYAFRYCNDFSENCVMFIIADVASGEGGEI